MDCVFGVGSGGIESFLLFGMEVCGFMRFGACWGGLYQGRHAAADELVIQSRRSFLQTGATLASLAVLDRFPALAEPAEIQPEAPVSQEALAGDGTATAQQSASKPKKSRVNTDTWYRFRGEGFTMKYPPDFEDIVEYDVSTNYRCLNCSELWVLFCFVCFGFIALAIQIAVGTALSDHRKVGFSNVRIGSLWSKLRGGAYENVFFFFPYLILIFPSIDSRKVEVRCMESVRRRGLSQLVLHLLTGTFLFKQFEY